MSAGQGIGAVIGATIGLVIGGPGAALKGAYWGYTAGSIIDPPPGPHLEGPRLNDRIIQTSEEGAPLPTVFGTQRISGNVVWSSGLEEIATTTEQGGGSGGGATSTTYSYKTDAAIALCSGSITGIRRIWADAKLIYDASENASLNTLLASEQRVGGIRVYTGSETQQPDPLIQSIEGAANTPAYRGMAYVVFEDLLLADFGNRLPNFSFEVVRNADPVAVCIDEIDLFRRAPPYPDDGAGVTYFDGAGWWMYEVVYTDNADPWSVTEFHVQEYYLALGETIPVAHDLISISGAMMPGNGVSYAYIARFKSNRRAFALFDLVGGYGGFRVYYRDDAGDWQLKSIWSPNGNGGSVDNAGPVAMVDDLIVMAGRNHPTSIRLEDSSYTYLTRPTSPSVSDYCWLAEIVLDKVVIGVDDGGTNKVWIYDASTLAYESSITISSAASTDLVGNLDALGNLWFTGLGGVLGGAYEGKLFKIATLLGTPGTEELIFSGLAQTDNDYEPNTMRTNWRIDTVGGMVAFITDNNSDTSSARQYMGVFGLYSYAQTAQPLDEVCAALMEYSGLSAAQYDVTALASDSVRGYTIGRPMAIRGAFEPLQTAWHFDLAEIDAQIVAVKRGGSVVATIPADDLGAAETPGSVPLKLTRNNDSELPSEIQISYSDIDNDHQAGTQYARSLTAQSVNIQQISLPLALTSQEAAQLAEIILNSSRYTGRHTLEFSLDYGWSRLCPTDVVSVPGYGVQWTARIGQIDLGAPGIVQVVASPEIAALYASILAGSDATGIGQTIGLTGTTTLNLIDCCLLRDTDSGMAWYVGLSGSVDTWPGGAVYKSSVNGATWTLATAATRTQAAQIGTATTALATADCRVWDKSNALNVMMQAGATLSSATELAVLDGANAALLGAHGRWELIQWLTATLESDGSYTLSNLLRGRKGTEHAASSHVIGDTFIVLSAATLQQLAVTTSELNAERLYKATTSGQLIEAVDSEAATYTGERLKPLAPADFHAIQQANGDIHLKWKRRDRIARAWSSSVSLPQSESTESYEIDIAIYGDIVRTLTATSESATYTAAEQLTDLDGVTSETATFGLYQISAAVGRGHISAISQIIEAAADTGIEPPEGGSDSFIFSAQSTQWTGTYLIAASQFGTGAWWYSADAATWTPATSTTSGPGETIVNGTTTISAYIPYIQVSTSATLATWTARSVADWKVTWAAFDDRVYAGVWDGTQYVYVHAGWNVLSTDTVSWSHELNDLPAPTYYDGSNLIIKRVLMFGSTYVAIFFASDLGGYAYFRRPKCYIYTSTDRVTWTLRYTGDDFTRLFDLWTDGSTLIAVGTKNATYNAYESPLVIRSTDATTWTEISMPSAVLTDLSLYGISALTSGRLVAVGRASYYSDDDGLTWYAAGAPATIGRIHGPGSFLAISDVTDTEIYTTTDGTTWLQEI